MAFCMDTSKILTVQGFDNKIYYLGLLKLGYHFWMILQLRKILVLVKSNLDVMHISVSNYNFQYSDDVVDVKFVAW